MKKLNIIIIIVSDTRTTTTDKSGKLLKQYITESGHNISNIIIVPDDIYLIRHNISQYLVDDEVDAIITSGGTGITGRDGTPEAVKVLLDIEIEGFGKSMSITVLDATGREISSELISGGEHTVKTQVDLGEMECGIYFIKISNGEKQQIERLIKN